MLTKQEREAITERLKDINDFCDRTLYTAITGKSVPRTTRYNEDVETMIQVILDLCDTSNMVELPRDKNGEVIRVGDEVCNELGNAGYVISIKYLEDEYIFVRVFDDIAGIVVAYSPNSLTHRHSTKAEQLAESITSAIEVFEDKLRELVAYVESLGDSDD